MQASQPYRQTVYRYDHATPLSDDIVVALDRSNAGARKNTVAAAATTAAAVAAAAVYGIAAAAAAAAYGYGSQ